MCAIIAVKVSQYASDKFINMEIADIKSRLTLSMVLNYYNLKPDKNDRLVCSFHNDKKPTL